MIVYSDASAIVKIYLAEDQSLAVADWLADADVVATHAIAYVETRSALARRKQDGSLTADKHDQALMALDADWPSFAQVSMDEHAAGDIAARHALRALDAIHVAAALELAHAAPEATVTFCSFDQRQLVAARAEGLVVLDPPSG